MARRFIMEGCFSCSIVCKQKYPEVTGGKEGVVLEIRMHPEKERESGLKIRDFDGRTSL